MNQFEEVVTEAMNWHAFWMAEKNGTPEQNNADFEAHKNKVLQAHNAEVVRERREAKIEALEKLLTYKGLTYDIHVLGELEQLKREALQSKEPTNGN